MNMSEDVTGVALQITEKTVSAGLQAAKTVLEMIGRLFKELMAMAHDQQRAKAMGGSGKAPKSTDLTDLKPGQTQLRDLVKSARKTGDSLSTSENGLTRADAKAIARKAKEYGIPVAFTNLKSKDNLYANVRSSDLPIFKQICTEVIKDKIAEKPQNLGNFKCEAWEMPFLTAELKNHDLAAQFAETKDGEHFCLYEKADEKAIKIARNEFLRKCDEVKKEIALDRDENGFYTIKDLRTGKEVSFDQIPSRETLSETLQSKFGYDANKADLACARFSDEMLNGKEKQQFLNSGAHSQFSKIEANVKLENESIYTKPYSCWYLTPKADEKPRVVFRDENGGFAVLTPDKMTRKQMQEVLADQLGITDRKELDALVDKAEKVSDYYARQDVQNLSHNVDFEKSDFDMSNPDVVSGMRRVDENGNVFTKSLPVDQANCQIERNGKDEFTVTSTVKSVETDQNGEHYTRSDTQTLKLSFSDKKNAIQELTELYQKQGIPEAAAKQMAKEVYDKAAAQSAEKVLQIEQVKAETITVSYGEKTAEINITDRDKAIEQMGKTFGVSDEVAAVVLDKAIEQTEQARQESQAQQDEKEKSAEKEWEEEKEAERAEEEKETERAEDEKETAKSESETEKPSKQETENAQKHEQSNGHERHQQEHQMPEMPDQNTGGSRRKR